MPDLKMTIIMPRNETAKKNERLADVLEYAFYNKKHDVINTADELRDYLDAQDTGHLLLFVIELGNTGINMEYYRMLHFIREHENCLEGYIGGLVVDGDSDLFTKSVAGELTFTANCAGCTFVGKPLVEGTKTLSNFAIIAQNMNTDCQTAYKESVRVLVNDICTFNYPQSIRPNLLVLHASNHETSNTFALWNQVKTGLDDFDITEIGLRNGDLCDCSGCPYKMCLHFGEKGSCFYGGVIVDDVYPAVKKANAILMLCPNYNDSLSANLTAFINRLTALFRTTRFYDKALFAIVVSGYSGSDIVAKQLISALNMNKTFYLPGHFAVMETANNPGTAVNLPGIEERISRFTEDIRKTLKREG
ncbi:MAG: NAD(P)H-dependent oxidoreductase [Clostridium sp.]